MLQYKSLKITFFGHRLSLLVEGGRSGPATYD